MANTDFKPTMVRNVEFKYPRLNSTYRYNTAEKRSEECAPTASNASYSVAWEMPQGEAAKLYAELKAHYENCNRKESFSKIFGMKKLDSGNVEFRAKRNGTNSQGTLNEKPRVIDGMKQPLAVSAIAFCAKLDIAILQLFHAEDFCEGFLTIAAFVMSFQFCM